MDARCIPAVLIGVGLSIFAPGPLTAGPAGAAEARPAAADGALQVPTTTIEIPASTPDATPAEPEVAVVGAKRKPRGPDSSPPPPADTAPPPPPPRVAPPPPPEPVQPERPPTPPVTAPEVLPAPAPPEPPPPARAPYSEPRVDKATRLPTTGTGLGSRSAALAGACLGLGGLFIAAGARRRQRRSP